MVIPTTSTAYEIWADLSLCTYLPDLVLWSTIWWSQQKRDGRSQWHTYREITRTAEQRTPLIL
jgi:hypothetical protein